jgi:hypothetical protein
VERSGRSVDEFLNGLADDVRPDMVALDTLISDVMLGTRRELYEGKFWGGSDQSIIGYGRMSSRRSDGATVEWFVIGLARQKQAISVYVSVVEDGRYLAEARGAGVGKVKVGKSVISFRSLDDIDTTKLRHLVERARELTTEE